MRRISHINPDHYLQTKHGRVYTPERSKLAWEQAYAALDAELSKRPRQLYIVCGVQAAGKTSWIRQHSELLADAVVFDAALPARQHRVRALALAQTHGVAATAVWLDSSLELALTRNANRAEDERVPPAAIRSVFGMLEVPSHAEGFVEIVHIDSNHAQTAIRVATPADLPAIAQVLVDTWRSTFQDLLPASFLDSLTYAQQEERHRTVMSNGTALYYVATSSAGTVLGFISVGPDHSAENRCDAEIYALYIRVQHQGQGIGRRLLQTASTTLAAQGKRSLRVWALSNNPYRHFYQRLGGQLQQSLPIQLGAEHYTQQSYYWPDLTQVGNS
ncbi:Acetyltransferase (GNAT) family protein [compost metagenome]